jgi:hypothetical protein
LDDDVIAALGISRDAGTGRVIGFPAHAPLDIAHWRSCDCGRVG